MKRWLMIVALVSACSEMTPPSTSERPQRIVSLDYCADQYVIKLADRDDILAVSPDAMRDFSYLREDAKGLPTTRPRTEDVLLLEPDLIVRSYGGGPQATRFFEEVGIPVVEIGYPQDWAAIAETIIRVATDLGQREQGLDVAREMNERLSALQDQDQDQTMLYVTPSGYTTGPGSLIDQLMRDAGYTNFEAKPGWRPLPLETLAANTPDTLAAGFFDTKNDFQGAWSTMRHPVADDLLSERPVAELSGAWLTCSAWFLVDAAEALANLESSAP